jgi:hypothetical protein
MVSNRYFLNRAASLNQYRGTLLSGLDPLKTQLIIVVGLLEFERMVSESL